MIKTFCFLVAALFYSLPALASLDARVFWYEEKESGTDVIQVRYLVTDRYIRIDEGSADDNFILYDDSARQVLSINHADHTILVIDNSDWQVPHFSFEHKLEKATLEQAPEVAGKKVKSYQLRAGGETCTDVQYLPGMFPAQMALFKRYQQVLSAQQVRGLNNTPLDMQTPCFLLDQVYNEGDYYDLGLPIQLWHARGYAKILKSFDDIKVESQLFKLPDNYSRYYPYNRATQTP